MSSITIRKATLEDADKILNIYTYYVYNTAITFEYESPSLEAFRERMAGTMKKFPYLVMEEDGKIVGYAYAGSFKGRAAYDWSCELTIYMSKDNAHKGLGKKLYAALSDELCKMGLTNLYACIAYPEADDEYLTKNSADFHEHLGFRQVGIFKKCGYKFNRWYDMVWMEKIVGDHYEKQNPIIPYPEMARH